MEDLQGEGALQGAGSGEVSDTAWHYAAVTEARRAGGERLGAVVRELERVVGDLEALWKRSRLGKG